MIGPYFMFPATARALLEASRKRRAETLARRAAAAAYHAPKPAIVVEALS
jgi:hypothetical protein